MTKQTNGKEPVDQAETLTDEELDQVNGGYSKVEWTVKETGSDREKGNLKLKLDKKLNKERIVAQSGDGEI